MSIPRTPEDRVYAKLENEQMKLAIMPHGFQKKGKLYYRLVNGNILQTVVVDGDIDTAYGFWTFCSKSADFMITHWGHFNNAQCFNSYRLGHPDYFGNCDKYSYPNQEEEERGMTEMERSVHRYVAIFKYEATPMFERAQDYASTLEVLDEFSDKFNKRYDWKYKENKKTQDRIYVDFACRGESNLWIRLALRRYEEAKKCMEQAIKRQKENRKKSYEWYIENHQPAPLEIEKWNEYVNEEYENLLAAIERNDTAYLDGLVKQNEERANDIIRNQLKLKV